MTAFDDCPGEHEFSAFNAVSRLLARGVPADRITMSSDCNGSLPVFDGEGHYAGMRIAGNTALLSDWQRLVRESVLPMEQALGLISGHVARVLGLEARKGRLAAGFDADIALLDDDLQPRHTFVAGRRIEPVACGTARMSCRG